MRVLTNKNGNFSSFFAKIAEEDNKNTSLKGMMIDNRRIQANK